MQREAEDSLMLRNPNEEGFDAECKPARWQSCCDVAVNPSRTDAVGRNESGLSVEVLQLCRV